jgi:hypothetical protein
MKLKAFVESIFPFELNQKDFQVKLSLVKSFILETSERENKDGTLMDITSNSTYSILNKIASHKGILISSDLLT